ncbi:M20 metallopeptidase family protein [Arthrobacter rhombi]|uniref:M20 metallopeptidase family protein n=1 Tax=Arthrobacter rhombi TaxID=71253 RepID=UPI003FD5BC3F
MSPRLSPELSEELIDFRRELHRIPEIGLELPSTQRAILDRISGLPGMEVSTGSRQSSITAVLRGAAPVPPGTRRPVVLLRGDMDALPVVEELEHEFVSATEGVMHACGHDLHVAALYGALRHLQEHRGSLVADVVFMFQPGEEAYDGARYMVEDGVLDAAGQRVDAAFGLHVFSANMDNGIFYCRPNTLMAGCEEYFVTVKGSGGHGSMPYLAQDPVPVACEMVLGLQTLVTRGFNVFDPLVATVGRIQAGTAGNIIPDTAEFDLSLRIFSPHNRDKILSDVERLMEGIAAAHGMEVRLVRAPDYPVTVNDPDEYAYAKQVVKDLLGPDSYRDLADPLPGSEDFSHVLQEVPGAYLLLGATMPGLDPATAAMNHSPRADFDDSVLPHAAQVLAELALRRGPVV